MIKVLSVIGTRPEAIKMGPVVRALQARPNLFESRVCVTGQHRALVDQVLALFEVVPDHDLNLLAPGQTLSRLSAAILSGMDGILSAERPDWVLVQGDTTTVMAASLAAFYRNVKVGHVEAGLRTYNKARPFPEEVNRRVATLVADLHFAPTRLSAQNLLREGVASESICVTGNPVIDAIQWVAALDDSPEKESQTPQIVGLPPLPEQQRVVLVTAHRRESFGRGIAQVCEAIQALAARHPDVCFVYPVHPNPNVQGPVHQRLSGVSGVVLLPPLDYRSFVHLIRLSTLVITDSGGLQEEAPGLGKPVLVLRESTERPEGIESGTVRLVGTDRDRIVEEASRLLTNPAALAEMARTENPYGDGQAAPRIAEALANFEARA